MSNREKDLGILALGHQLVVLQRQTGKPQPTWPWPLTPGKLERYFARPAAGHTTVRPKITKIDRFFAFLEQCYTGETLRRFGAAVESPVDTFNRPRRRGSALPVRRLGP